jgi:uncharacterized protein
MIDLRENYLQIVKSILAGHVPGQEVRIFGSRVTGEARDYSDLDLVIMGQQKIDRRTLYDLAEAFEESDLPMRVDVLDWQRISETFRGVIEQAYVVLQPAPPGRHEMTTAAAQD